jgi:hypothetical protein
VSSAASNVRAAAIGLVLAILAIASAGCGGETIEPQSTVTASITRSPPTPTATIITPLPPTPGAQLEPFGFPIDPEMALGLVDGPVGGRSIRWGAGPAAEAYSRGDQPSDDPERANRSGWNCRVHVEYEGQPAVDWYVPTGTDVASTMDGTATLYVITVTNAFDHYGVDREPYLGNPDRARAPLSPFPGPGGGKGVFVQVVNDSFVTEYAHLDLGQTIPAVPASAFLPGFGAATDYAGAFAAMRDFRDWTPIATWSVRRGAVIGRSGDAGYSEAPHLHYTVRRADGPLLCPTAEDGFGDGGWLLRTAP